MNAQRTEGDHESRPADVKYQLLLSLSAADGFSTPLWAADGSYTPLWAADSFCTPLWGSDGFYTPL